MKRLLIVSAIALTSKALAGWHSGGGELIADAQNPWFLANTPTATYCIMIGSDFSVQDEAKLTQVLESALNYWKGQFAAVAPYQKARLTDNYRIEVGTQNFVKVDCGANPDLAIQFGKLTSLQRQAINEPTRFAALTIRTDYDAVNLRGKGFIYVSPDRGPDAYRGENIRQNAWSLGTGGYLLLTLVHELGHVFGIPHVSQSAGGYQLGALMSDDFVEDILRADNDSDYADFNSPGDFLIPRRMFGSWTICRNAQHLEFRRFFGMNPATSCVIFRVSGQTISVFERADDFNAPETRLGVIDLTDSTDFLGNQTPHSNLSLGRLYVTNSQSVLPVNVTRPMAYPIMEAVIFKLHGNFTRVGSNTSQPLLMTIGTDGIDFTATVDGKVSERFLWGW